jgi:hypothetical protein
VYVAIVEKKIQGTRGNDRKEEKLNPVKVTADNEEIRFQILTRSNVLITGTIWVPGYMYLSIS